ncbi:MAG: FAD synthetase family protein, partial [Candidatus Omnitrophica bacterium]|nr:FAD synthetase family protein [Candidatus Omnitrophota bacterium]
MEIVTDLKRVQKRAFGNLVLALGNFDGVHLGHLEILGLIQKHAQTFRGEAAVFTFKEHPQRILHRKEDPLILTSLIHKLTLLKQAGIRLCFLVDFTAAISEKSPEAFVREVLVDTLGIRAVCLGFNARFGHNRSGDSRLMKQLAEKYRFTFLEAPSYELEGQVVSSSLIRSLVREGKLK